MCKTYVYYRLLHIPTGHTSGLYYKVELESVLNRLNESGIDSHEFSWLKCIAGTNLFFKEEFEIIGDPYYETCSIK